MAAVLAEGETVIDNAAREPEIVDLCNMLVQMGARISGAGTTTLTIRGVEKLRPTTHRVIGDRIVAATWAIAATMTLGDVRVVGVNPKHLALVLDKLVAAGVADHPAGRRFPGGAARASARGERLDAAVSRLSRPTCSRWRSVLRRSRTEPR